MQKLSEAQARIRAENHTKKRERRENIQIRRRGSHEGAFWKSFAQIAIS